MTPNTIYQGDSLEVLKSFPSESVDCCITSPPYFGLRDYGMEGQIGLEDTPEAFVQRLTEVFREVRRVLKKEGTLWLNLGDSYSNDKVGNKETNKHKKAVTDTFKKGDSGLPHKNLIGIPWRTAFALQADGWYLRQDIIWAKPNPMPESVTDRCTKSHEYIFLLSKNKDYYFDNEAIAEPAIHKEDPRAGYGRLHYRGKREGQEGTGQENFVSIKETRNKRSVWTVTTKPFLDAHFATFPEDLIAPMIKAGCPQGGIVLDVFMGAGTTAAVARKLNRKYVGIELNGEYIKIAERRLSQEALL